METESKYAESDEAKLEELASILQQAHEGKDVIEFYNFKLPYLKQLKEKHPDIGDYKLYHLLIGSSGYKGDSEMELDLPNGEMEAFIRSL